MIYQSDTAVKCEESASRRERYATTGGRSSTEIHSEWHLACTISGTLSSLQSFHCNTHSHRHIHKPELLVEDETNRKEKPTTNQAVSQNDTCGEIGAAAEGAITAG